jgi:di/tricarboxylate transporter
MAPIAISAAEAIGCTTYSFVTPESSPAVTLVVAPGKYRFIHFVKVGSP